MKKRYIALICAAVLIFVSAIWFMAVKGFFTDPANFMQLAKNKITKIYNDVTNTEPEIQEEIITTADGHKVLLDRPKGYSLSFPLDMSFDLSISPEQIKAYNDDMTVIVTREWAPYDDVEWYIDNYLNNYYLDEHYIQTNNITIHEHRRYEHNKAAAQLVSLSRSPESQDIERQNHYTYFYVLSKTGKQAFFRVMFKTKDYEKSAPVIEEIINSFEEIRLEGENVFKARYYPNVPSYWNSETKALWKQINSQKDFKWGIFVDGAYDKERNYQWLQDLEEKVDYEFDFALHYVNLGWEFPVKSMQKLYDDGKITELTLQISNWNNDDLFGKNINFDVYDGVLDEQIREFARGAKAFGHPFLFRLNNEMNSDWVNYSGVAALSDPEIFIENWRRIYNIFEEEGVDNAIWIFNPNAEDCPPAHWNSYISYYPGNEYVHMIGMTGYNTGEYYKELYHEKWRSFDEIYKEPYEKYMNVFSEFPFIITEFASSSIGGDKPAWIKDMFESIKKYDNIKMALWWSSADYDMRPETYKHIARPYFLDETDETTKAFREGVKKYK
ncbi:MAG: hypothetical protein E7410_01800 [Ruminococcaceae bacterium]|nr:hypothetical protein [Oscillospiraceae bacterium]